MKTIQMQADNFTLHFPHDYLYDCPLKIVRKSDGMEYSEVYNREELTDLTFYRSHTEGRIYILNTFSRHFIVKWFEKRRLRKNPMVFDITYESC